MVNVNGFEMIMNLFFGLVNKFRVVIILGFVYLNN